MVMLLSGILNSVIAQTGNVGIGTASPDGTSKLDITATDKGMLIPRVALSAANAASPITRADGSAAATGDLAVPLLVYNTATSGTGVNRVTPGYYYWNGTIWVQIQASNTKDWATKGNPDAEITSPAVPGTYGTSTFGTDDNWIGNIGNKDFTIGTNNTERMRVMGDGRVGIGTAAPVANTLLTINPYSNTWRHGINMPFPGSGTITSTAYGIDMPVTTNQNVRGFRYTNSTTGNGVFWGTGAELSATNIVSGYTGYRNSSGLSYGIYGITGTNLTYNGTNANTWALWSQGRAVISGESSPTSTLDVDLEIRNTTTGAGNPATLSMRQSTANGTSRSILANINFGDNRITGPQAQIQAFRDTTSSSATDLPTALIFSTTPDGSATMSERVRIANNGFVGIGLGNGVSPTYNLHVENLTNRAYIHAGIAGSTESYATIARSNWEGVLAYAYNDDGVEGQTASSAYTGVSGINLNTSSGIGVYGEGYTVGVYGYTPSTGNGTFGVRGDWSSSRFGYLGGRTNTSTPYYIGAYGTVSGSADFAVLGWNTNSSGTAVVGAGNNLTGATYLVAGSGGSFSGSSFGAAGWSTTTTTGIVRAGGYFDSRAGTSFAYVGAITAANVNRKIEGNGTVNTVVKDLNNNNVVMSCPEAPENFFQDFGTGKLINGRATVELDKIFTKNIIVNDKHPLRVIIQLEGDCNGVYVTNKSASGFEVIELQNGKSDVPFTWFVTANRADEVMPDGTISRYSSERFAPAMGAQPQLTAEMEKNSKVEDSKESLYKRTEKKD